MSDQAIRRALMARLDTVSFTPISGTLEKHYQGDVDDFTKGNPTLRPYYLSEGDIPLTTNPIQTRADRLFNVQCWVDEREGEDEAYRLADAVSAHFYPDNGSTYEITTGSIWIQINRRPEKEPLTARSGFVGVSCLIRCFALI